MADGLPAQDRPRYLIAGDPGALTLELARGPCQNRRMAGGMNKRGTFGTPTSDRVRRSSAAEPEELRPGEWGTLEEWVPSALVHPA